VAIFVVNATARNQDVVWITQPLFFRVFTAFFQGFSRVLFSSRVFRSGSYNYLEAATDSRRHVPAHMLSL
jgi:hypothetical protein